MNSFTPQRGMTLIELIVAITIIGISIISILGLLSFQASRSSNAMIQAQAAQIADAYLNEVTQKSFLPLANPSGRANFNDIDDYNGLNDAVATDQSGMPVPGLDGFSVSIQIIATTLNTVPAKRIDVTVQHINAPSVVATGYRTQ